MVTFLGNPVSFTGKQLQVGDKALDFSLTTTDLSTPIIHPKSKNHPESLP
ncbi:thiol peroxidase [Streptococcus pneumoniae]|nr:thiol peroxidase [Streptococcus pneumoniae]